MFLFNKGRLLKKSIVACSCMFTAQLALSQGKNVQPFTVKASNQHVYYQAVSYDPYGFWDGEINVYKKKEHLYAYPKYIKNQLVYLSDDGTYMALIRNEFANIKEQPGQEDYAKVAIAIYKDAELYENILLSQILDSTQQIRLSAKGLWLSDSALAANRQNAFVNKNTLHVFTQQGRVFQYSFTQFKDTLFALDAKSAWNKGKYKVPCYTITPGKADYPPDTYVLQLADGRDLHAVIKKHFTEHIAGKEEYYNIYFKKFSVDKDGNCIAADCSVWRKQANGADKQDIPKSKELEKWLLQQKLKPFTYNNLLSHYTFQFKLGI